jgi:S-adenosylmethionine:tRNA ribosyltransferase-isomerase
MQLDDFNYQLPEALIARHPLAERTHSRLLCLDGQSGTISHALFSAIGDYLMPGDLLVLNDTQVIPARLYGHKDSGGQLELLVERLVDDQQFWAQVRASKTPKPGSYLWLTDPRGVLPPVKTKVIERQEALFLLAVEADQPLLQLIESIGQLPLPPYLERPADSQDQQRYQTVYARHKGAVAAPTAGLHFSEPLLEQLQVKGVELGYLTLHVGAGTFQPVRVTDIRQHKMHKEVISVGQSLCDQIIATQARGGAIVAVGTTTVRALETASQQGQLQPYRGETDIFIYPGYQFKLVDKLITNFHLPGSSLLMLVCAFAGYQHTMAAYQAAIAKKYRFYSYGDAMLLSRH